MHEKADDIYVLGCGPSLKGYDFTRLNGLTTIAVNGVLRDYPDATYFVTADSTQARAAVKYSFWGSDAFKVLVMGDNHRAFKRIKDIVPAFNWRIPPARYNGEIGFICSEFATGQNSGFCGMQLAVIMGARRIHLLGIDLHAKGGCHYHNYYPGDEGRYNEFFYYFLSAINKLEAEGIQVISHSPTSRLNDHVVYRGLP